MKVCPLITAGWHAKPERMRPQELEGFRKMAGNDQTQLRDVATPTS